jgi:hypothetical protein
MKMRIPDGCEKELCAMLIECCSQERTYLRYYGLLAQRFSFIKMEYQMEFETAFQKQYGLIHRLETNKLRNTAKFFSHLMATDALPWTVRAPPSTRFKRQVTRGLRSSEAETIGPPAPCTRCPKPVPDPAASRAPPWVPSPPLEKALLDPCCRFSSASAV